MSRAAPTREEAEAIAGLGAAAASGDAAALESALDAAAGLVDADDVEELLLQTYLFAGFPRTINAFYTWQRRALGGGGRGALVVEPEDGIAWRQRGEALCRTIYRDTFDALQARLSRLHPALAEWTLVEGYGKVLSRPGPDPARRELAAVGALIVVDAGRQLESHLKGALHAGVDREVLAAAAGAVARRWERPPVADRIPDAEAGDP